MARIYLSPPHPSGRELEFVGDAIASNWLAPLGPHVDAFEDDLSKVVGVPNALALSSGTAALHLALVVLGIGAGDEVVCSSLTFAGEIHPRGCDDCRAVATIVWVYTDQAAHKSTPLPAAIVDGIEAYEGALAG